MHRADHITRLVNANGTGKDGYTQGSVSPLVPPTQVTAEALNAFQEEPANAIELFFALNKLDNTQLRSALEKTLDQVILAYIGAQSQSAVALANRGDAGTGTFMDAASDENQTIVCAFLQSSNQIYSSTDGGATFASRALGSAATTGLYGVAWSPTLSLFCAVGETGEIQTSPDGVTWTRRTPGSAFAGTFLAIAWSDSHAKFIAVGANGEVQTSSNGTAWTRLSNNAGAGAYRCVAANGSTVVAISGSSYVFRSTDLVAFTETDLSSGGLIDANEGQGLGVIGDQFVTVCSFNGSTTFSIVASVDGIRWRSVASYTASSSNIRHPTSRNGSIARETAAGWDVLTGKAGGNNLRWSRARPSPGVAGIRLFRTRLAWVGADTNAVVYCSALTP